MSVESNNSESQYTNQCQITKCRVHKMSKYKMSNSHMCNLQKVKFMKCQIFTNYRLKFISREKVTFFMAFQSFKTGKKGLKIPGAKLKTVWQQLLLDLSPMQVLLV